MATFSLTILKLLKWSQNTVKNQFNNSKASSFTSNQNTPQLERKIVGTLWIL